MAFLFNRSRTKSPQDLVRSLRDSIHRLDSPADKRRAQDDVSRGLAQMKVILYGDGDAEPIPDQFAALCQESYATDLLPLLALNIWRFEFEARKDVTSIFNTMLRRQLGQRYPTVDYLCGKEDTLFALIKGYNNKDIALNCGQMLRECIKFESLAKIMLFSDYFWMFIGYVENGNFDITSDAFSTFKELLTRHKSLAAEFLLQNYDIFFAKLTALIESENYVVKRQSLKLLGEILLDRANFAVMTQYIASAENLKLMMILLKDRSKNIQFEAFHVFKVFVANPNKTPEVQKILVKNRDKLLVFLSGFHNDRKDDEQFNDEKAFLIKQIEVL
ncbi:Hym1p [Saitoella coloradoensis]